VIVNDFDDAHDFAGVVASDFQNQPPLQIESHRVLPYPVSFELLEVEGLQLHEVALVSESSNLLHPFSIRPDDLLGEARRELGVSLKAVQVVIVELNFHRGSLGKMAYVVKSTFTLDVNVVLLEMML
jgi:hypothetical protein